MLQNISYYQGITSWTSLWDHYSACHTTQMSTVAWAVIIVFVLKSQIFMLYLLCKLNKGKRYIMSFLSLPTSLPTSFASISVLGRPVIVAALPITCFWDKLPNHILCRGSSPCASLAGHVLFTAAAWYRVNMWQQDDQFKWWLVQAILIVFKYLLSTFWLNQKSSFLVVNIATSCRPLYIFLCLLPGFWTMW